MLVSGTDVLFSHLAVTNNVM